MLSREESNNIEIASSDLERKGFNADTVVFRDNMRVAFALAVVATPPFDGKFRVTLGRNFAWCAIGTKGSGTGRQIRDAVHSCVGHLSDHLNQQKPKAE